MSYRRQQKPALDKATIQKFADHLVGKGDDMTEGQYLDMRTIIHSAPMVKTILYYRGLQELYKSESAGRIADLLERVAISFEGKGRDQSVLVMLAGQLQSGRAELPGGVEILPAELTKQKK